MRRHAASPPILALVFAILCGISDLTGASSATQRFEQLLVASNHPSPPPYRAFRKLEASLADSSKRGWIEAWTEFRPGSGFHFDVVNEGGSEYVRNNILREVLIKEQDLLAAGKRIRASLESGNYEFSDGGVTAGGLQRVVLKPAKKSDGLVDGSLLLDRSSKLLARIEGRLVKSPSFWMRDVDVTWSFEQIGGYLVPTEMTSTGRVRMFGRASFRMTYEYASIGGVTLVASSQ